MSRHEARHSRCSSAIGLMQKREHDMTHLRTEPSPRTSTPTTITPHSAAQATRSATSKPGTTATTRPSSSGTRQKSPKVICPTERSKRGRPTWVGPVRVYHQAVRYVKSMNAAITTAAATALRIPSRGAVRNPTASKLVVRGEKATALMSVQPRRQTEPIQSLSRPVSLTSASELHPVVSFPLRCALLLVLSSPLHHLANVP